jgi:hypothetical protein
VTAQREQRPRFTIVPAGTKMAQCKACENIIFFVCTKNDRLMPVDCDADECHRPTDREPGLGIVHFATCSSPAYFRRGGR